MVEVDRIVIHFISFPAADILLALAVLYHRAVTVIPNSGRGA
jgi:uncharacterized membrane protein YGL010W